MEVEALGLVKAGCLSRGECQVSEAAVGGWVGEHPHRSRGEEGWDGIVCLRKGNWEGG